MIVIVANCRFEGTKILVPFLLENLVPDEKSPFRKGFIWEGQIDTGFDGYLMMPFKDVRQNGLELAPTLGSWTVADGNNMTTIDTFGKLTLVGRSSFALVNSPITTNPNILIGQKMLEAWNVKLEVDPVNKIAQLIALPPKTKTI